MVDIYHLNIGSPIDKEFFLQIYLMLKSSPQ